MGMMNWKWMVGRNIQEAVCDFTIILPLNLGLTIIHTDDGATPPPSAKRKRLNEK